MGARTGLYLSPPFIKGTKQQGPQDADGPAVRYRKALAALDQYCREQKRQSVRFAERHGQECDHRRPGDCSAKPDGADGQVFFALLLKNTLEGFFDDPIYGGNRDMVGWSMIAFRARATTTGWVQRHDERYPVPPGSFKGRRGLYCAQT